MTTPPLTRPVAERIHRAHGAPAWPVLAILATSVVVLDDATGGVSRAAVPELGPTVLDRSTGAGVALVFVVTAVELCRSMSRDGIGAAVRARLVRTLPGYWAACLLILLAGSLVRLPASVSMTDPAFSAVVDNLVLLPRLVASPMVDVAFWVVTAQLLGCAGAALLWSPVRAVRVRLHALLAVLIAAPWAVPWLAGPVSGWEDPARRLWLTAGGDDLHAWAIGIALWCVAARSLPRPAGLGYLAAALAVDGVLASSPVRTAVLGGAVVLGLLLGLSGRVGAPRPLRAVADLGLPVFLVHNALTVALALAAVRAGLLSGAGATVVLLAGPWVLGAAYWRLVHAPLVRWLDGDPRTYG